MSGLIWAGIGKGIADAGSTIGGFMMKRIAADEDREDRQRERRQELEDRREYEEKRDAMYRRTADQQAAASSRGSGNSREYTPDEQTMMAVESGRFLSQADVDKFRNAVKTGDYSGYKEDVTKATVTDEGDPYRSEVSLTTAKDYPPGFEREVQAKAKVLATISRESVHGKNYKEVTEGRQNEFETGVGQGILSGAISPGRGAAATGGMKGNAVFDGDSNTTRNRYTGASEPTKVGESQIAENLAQARKALADAAKPGGGKGESQEKLATMLTSLTKILDNPDISDKDRKAVGALQMQIANAISATVDARAPGAGKAEKPSEADAHAQARAALATGKISLADANKRLEGAGYKPLPADAAGGKTAKGDAPKSDAPAKADKPERSIVSGMSNSMLQRLANTDGHVNQAAAKAELARRKEESDAYQSTWNEMATGR